MRILRVIILSASIIFAVCCGKPENGIKRTDGNAQATHRDSKNSPNADAQSEAIKTPVTKRGGDIDIDKLDIPDRVKEDIKSGRIPEDKIPEILAQLKGGSFPGADLAATPVSVEPVQRQNLNSYLVLNGVVEPERKVEIFSRLPAYVKKIIKEEGAYVRENDILAFLDDTEIKISHEQAKIELEQAELSLEEAKNNFTRNQELIKRDLISQQEFQTQEAQYKQRQLDHQNKTENFKNLQLQLNWTKIRALSEGYITERLIEVGDRVTANQQVYTVEDFKPLLVRVFVPASDAPSIETQMPAEVTTEVLKETVFMGNVKLINPRIDVQTGTVKVTVEVFDESLRLKPGMFVEVRIVTGVKKDLVVIPRKSILYKQNKTYVFVLKQGAVSQREVALGLTEEDDVEVISGLEKGEIIVVVGIEGLKDGQRVDVVQ
ncbi:MAG: efflux RND transporter periplasmic adaptor subunit [Candidatus Aminicenantes bacterium]|nr:efflux RND transporter periplasmic adaptor subunit [Candidatus Aminicenantes bacterium]